MPDNEARAEAFRLVEEDLRQGIGAVGFVPNERGREPQGSDDAGNTQACNWGAPFNQQDEADRDDAIERFTVVPWEFECNHVGGLREDIEDAGIFHGLFPTGRDVTIRGVTFVDRSGVEPQFHRYVDWADALTQLGCTVSQRVLLGEDAYQEGLRTLNPREEQS